jgi:hypothetical protein
MTVREQHASPKTSRRDDPSHQTVALRRDRQTAIIVVLLLLALAVVFAVVVLTFAL